MLKNADSFLLKINIWFCLLLLLHSSRLWLIFATVHQLDGAIGFLNYSAKSPLIVFWCWLRVKRCNSHPLLLNTITRLTMKFRWPSFVMNAAGDHLVWVKLSKLFLATTASLQSVLPMLLNGYEIQILYYDGELWGGVMYESIYIVNGRTFRTVFDGNKPAVSAFHLQSSYDHGLGMFIAPVDRSGVLSWW